MNLQLAVKVCYLHHISQVSVHHMAIRKLEVALLLTLHTNADIARSVIEGITYSLYETLVHLREKEGHNAYYINRWWCENDFCYNYKLIFLIRKSVN